MRTYRNTQNWFSYYLPPPRDSEGEGQETCLKCLSPFFLDNNLQSIVAFNLDSKQPWGQPNALQEPATSCLTITFTPAELLIMFSALHEDQQVLRDGLNNQRLAAGQPPPIFEGFIQDIPKIEKSKVQKFDFATCPCGLTDKNSTRHKANETHKAWLLRQASHAESEPLAGAHFVPRWWS